MAKILGPKTPAVDVVKVSLARHLTAALAGRGHVEINSPL
jgi:hypothetical protein